MTGINRYENMDKCAEQAQVCNDLIEQIAQLIHSDLPQKQFAELCYELCTHYPDPPNITLSAVCLGLVLRWDTALTRWFTQQLTKEQQGGPQA